MKILVLIFNSSQNCKKILKLEISHQKPFFAVHKLKSTVQAASEVFSVVNFFSEQQQALVLWRRQRVNSRPPLITRRAKQRWEG